MLPPIPPRLIRRLQRFRLEDEPAAWTEAYQDYVHGLEYGTAVGYLDEYLAWCELNGHQPTVARFRRWVVRGESFGHKEEAAQRHAQEEANQQAPQTPEEVARERWNRRWCDQ